LRRIGGYESEHADTVADLARTVAFALIWAFTIRGPQEGKPTSTRLPRASCGILQRTCACCNEKGVCEKDFTEHPDDPVWKSYCSNAVTLESLTELKARSST
jgi:hypothetical protein